ncbi:hypothetical protein ASF01_07450 [Stenotrophomonas sp. Leaf70]|uniref:DUF4124 domain-containing protein n=1 Tax=Stenotrophomonas sp. Leaf70 TaxID=1736233 RepID=UPI0006FC3D0A|nr:DUF4124 domain-containing protein [Stenotrophomonas sp. Leaf70]KQN99368.1 hypothetical protein ASF01_07450 [Stenotrophomonas sp. Leaf70]
MPAMPAIVLLTLLFLLPDSASAQVYKCKGKSGETAYSEHPCDASAQPMKLRDERPAASPPPMMESAPQESSPLRESDAAPAPAAALDRSAERECIANATASIYGPSNDRVATYQQQMTMLNEQFGNATDAQRSDALQARMVNLRRAISREHAYAHEQVNAARRRCVEQYRAATP